MDNGHPLATCKGRGADEGMAWCKSRPQDERERVAVVVWARSTPFCAAVQAGLGERGHVIARFPSVTQAVDALDAVGRAGHKQRDPEEAQALKKRRTRWRKSAAPLQVDA